MRCRHEIGGCRANAATDQAVNDFFLPLCTKLFSSLVGTT